MNLKIYNISLLIGLALVGLGVGLWWIPAGIAITGALLIALTLINVIMFSRVGGG